MTDKLEPEIRKRKKEGKSGVTENGYEDVLNDDTIPPKYGPMPTFPNQRMWARLMLILGTLVVVYFTSNNDKVTVLARLKDLVEYRRQNTPCFQEYVKEVNSLPERCRLEKCGMVVRDRILTEKEVQGLFDMVHDLYRQTEAYVISLDTLSKFSLTSEQMKLLRTVRKKIEEAVGPPEGHLKPVEPSHFARLTADTLYPYKEKCRQCHFNALLYLNDFSRDFEGGRSVFLQQDNSTIIVEPKKGRLVGWNGGGWAGVEAVSSGASHTLRLGFACS